MNACNASIFIFNYTVTVILGNAFGNFGDEGFECSELRSSI